jgi:hypothetical protein
MKRHLLWSAVVCAAMGLAGPAGAKEAAVRCANLIYAGTQTSRCFSDEFLSSVQRESTIATERRFKSVKLDSEELFAFPFVVMTGEKEFYLSGKERENLKKYLTRGGFLLASAGCSSKEWDRSFRREMRQALPERKLNRIAMDHAVFKTVKTIPELKLSHGGSAPCLEGVENDGKMVVIYSSQGLNDTAHTVGCCCCGGNEIVNSMEVNVNILVYALTH